MHDDQARVLARVARFTRERLTPAIHPTRVPLDVAAWAAPDEPVPFAQATVEQFEAAGEGTAWGRPWGTVWFRVDGQVPDDWTGDELRTELLVDLGFSDRRPGFQAEATVYDAAGEVLGGVHPRKRHIRLDAEPSAQVRCYVEAAANPDVAGGFEFSPTPLGDLTTAGSAPQYVLGRIELARFDRTVWELVQDIATLTGLAEELDDTSARRATIVAALADAMAAVDPDDVAATAALGRTRLADVLASPAHASAHRIHAVGHAHIDSAWLWPLRETARKVTRTFANVLELLDDGEDLVYAASSAQHYAWIREHQPQLFERIRERVADGSIVPVGGMWVESDVNMPGGEALARQLIVGKRWFMAEFDVEPVEVWLPDSFGYSAALPQLVLAAGSRWFLTQKLSWNETNRMPHHTFWWEGIDGSRVLTHFPPVDTYNSDLSPADLAYAAANYAEKGRASTSMVPFGWGNGGGGPTREMIAAAARARDLEGSPTVRVTSPAAFFEAAVAEYDDPPVWSGELYLETHRGTYTSQAATKRGNRRNEHLLREAELWSTSAAVRLGADYPYEELAQLWRTVLLLQFHDILPGSSIAWVHQQAEQLHAEATEELEQLIDRSLDALVGSGDTALAANAGPRGVDGVDALSVGRPAGPGRDAAAADALAGRDVDDAAPVATVDEAPDGIVLTNPHLRVEIDRRGLIVSVHDVMADRELVPPGAAANLLQLHRDTPTSFDAWDVDEDYRDHHDDLTAVDELEITGSGPQRAAVRIVRRIRNTTIAQTVALRADARVLDLTFDIDWQERQKILKLAWPVDVHADRATSEIQFGHIHRPTHANTSWDAARYETCAHRWVHVGEPGYGVAVANDAVYGHDVTRTTRSGGGTTTTVRLSLLRAPTYPDPSADVGRHAFAVAVRPGATIADAVDEGYRLNLPLRRVTGDAEVAPLIAVDGAAVVIEAVKLAEDRSGDVVVRCYEAHGSRATATLTTDFAHGTPVETDLLERPLDTPRALSVDDDAVLRLEVRPFQIVTLRFPRPT